VSIQISVDTVSPKLDHLLRQAKDMSPILRAMGTEFMAITDQAFDNPSLRLAEWAARKKTKKKEADRPLLIGNPLHMKKAFHISVGPDSVTIGNPVKYARIHQFGGMTGKGHKTKIPARPFMPISKEGVMPEWAQVKIAKAGAAAAKVHLGI